MPLADLQPECATGMEGEATRKRNARAVSGPGVPVSSGWCLLQPVIRLRKPASMPSAEPISQMAAGTGTTAEFNVA